MVKVLCSFSYLSPSILNFLPSILSYPPSLLYFPSFPPYFPSFPCLSFPFPRLFPSLFLFLLSPFKYFPQNFPRVGDLPTLPTPSYATEDNFTKSDFARVAPSSSAVRADICTRMWGCRRQKYPAGIVYHGIKGKMFYRGLRARRP